MRRQRGLRLPDGRVQSEKLRGREFLWSCLLNDSDLIDDRGNPLRSQPRQFPDPPDKLLPPKSEESHHKAPKARDLLISQRRRIERRQSHDRRIDLRPWMKRSSRDREESLNPRHRAHPDSERAVLCPAGLGPEPLRDLLLHQEHDSPWSRRRQRQVNERRRDVVWDVTRDNKGTCSNQLMPIRLERISLDDLDRRDSPAQ